MIDKDSEILFRTTERQNDRTTERQNDNTELNDNTGE